MQVRSLGWEDFLGWEKAMATHSSVLAWKIPWTEKPGELQSTVNYSPWGCKEWDTTEVTQHECTLCAKCFTSITKTLPAYVLKGRLWSQTAWLWILALHFTGLQFLEISTASPNQLE